MKATEALSAKQGTVSSSAHRAAFDNAQFAVQRKSAKTSPAALRNHLKYSLSNLNLANVDTVTGLPTTEIHHLAVKGVGGIPRTLPYADKIQQSFGEHDISHIQAYTDSNAQSAAKAIGARAYATGNKIAFASANPSLFEVAHEAAHVVQQQSHVQLFGGLGKENDRYEQNADAVAAATIQGKPGENLLDQVNAHSTAETAQINTVNNHINQTLPSNTQNSVQRIVEYQSKKGGLIKVKKDKSFLDKQKGDSSYFDNDIMEVADELSGVASNDEVKNCFTKLIDDTVFIHTFVNSQHNTEETAFDVLIKYLYNLFDAKIDYNDDAILLYFSDTQIGFVPKGEETPSGGIDGYYVRRKNSLEKKGVPLVGNFFPRTFELTEKNYMNKNKGLKSPLEEYKTKIDDKGKAKGFGDGTSVLQTNIEWKDAENKMGTQVTAKVLGPEHPLGSTPDCEEADAARNNMELLAGGQIKGPIRYINGHLLNEQLGGPGTDVRNLAPITSQDNAIHKNRVESRVKQLVNLEHCWVYYEVTAEQKKMDKNLLKARTEYDEDEDSEKEIEVAKNVEEAAEEVGENYVKKFVCVWQQLDASGKSLIGTREEVTLNFKDPLAIYDELPDNAMELKQQKKFSAAAHLNKMFEGENRVEHQQQDSGGTLKDASAKTPFITTNSKTAKFKVQYNHIILTLEKVVEAKLNAAGQYEKVIAGYKNKLSGLEKDYAEINDILEFISTISEQVEDYLSIEGEEAKQDFYTAIFSVIDETNNSEIAEKINEITDFKEDLKEEMVSAIEAVCEFIGDEIEKISDTDAQDLLYTLLDGFIKYYGNSIVADIDNEARDVIDELKSKSQKNMLENILSTINKNYAMLSKFKNIESLLIKEAAKMYPDGELEDICKELVAEEKLSLESFDESKRDDQVQAMNEVVSAISRKALEYFLMKKDEKTKKKTVNKVKQSGNKTLGKHSRDESIIDKKEWKKKKKEEKMNKIKEQLKKK